MLLAVPSALASTTTSGLAFIEAATLAVASAVVAFLDLVAFFLGLTSVASVASLALALVALVAVAFTAWPLVVVALALALTVDDLLLATSAACGL